MDIPFISREQMTRLDEVMVSCFGIEIIQMMEHAGRNTAAMARNILGELEGKDIIVLAGKGNNGGDAIVAARFLHNWGAKVKVILAEPIDKLKVMARKNIKILNSMGVKWEEYTGSISSIENTDLIIDGLLGYNIKGDPMGPVADLIELANSTGKKILSIDVPSGMDPDKGGIYTPCIRATHTLSLSLPKKGLSESKELVGELYVADVGVPPELFRLLEMEVKNIFRKKEIIRVW